MPLTAPRSEPARRSPIREKPKRQAGETLRAELFFRQGGSVMFAAGVAFIAVFIIAVVWTVWWLKPEWTPWAVTIAAIAMFAGTVRFAAKAWRGSKNLQLGLDGEVTVGQMLDQLRGLGYEALHDVPGEREGTNIDHVLIGPAGVFTIETKTRSKVGNQKVSYDGHRITIDGRDRSEPLAQARACRDDVRRRINQKLGRDDVPVRAIVVFTGWYVNERKGLSAPNDVWVLNENRVQKWIENEPRRIPDIAFGQIASALGR